MLEPIATLLDLLTRREFVVGVAIGIGAVFIIAVVARNLGRSYAKWDVAIAVSVILGLQFLLGLPMEVVGGMGLMLAGGGLLERASRTLRIELTVTAWSLIVLGNIVMFALGDLPGHWTTFAAIPASLVGGGLVAQWRTVQSDTLIGPMWAIACFGLWATVPDTDGARALLGISIPLAFASLPWVGGKTSRVGAFAAVGIFIWLAAVSGATRPASVIGAWSSLALIVSLPLVTRYRARPRFLESNQWIIAIHTAWVLFSARIVGLWESSTIAAAVVTVLMFAAGLLLTRRESVESVQADADRPMRGETPI